MRVVDCFAGPGGWSEGIKSLGVRDIGIEWDHSACMTRIAAGHMTIQADVHEYPAEVFRGYEGLIMSPPCTAFSTAGKGRGRELIDQLITQILHQDWTPIPDELPTVWLPLEVGRWIEAVQPTWLACEQVPPALALWQAYEPWLRSLGYSTWCGVLNAADYGVPQTRQRAFLIASKDKLVGPPAPTHCRGGRYTLEGELEPWISMAEALGWGMRVRPARTITSGGEGFNGKSTRELMRDLSESGDDDIWLDRRQTGAPVVNVSEEPSPTVGSAVLAKGVWKVTEGEKPDPAWENWTVATGNTSAVTDENGDRIPVERGLDEPAPTIKANSVSDWRIKTGANSVTNKNTDRPWTERSKPYERSLDEPAPTLDSKTGSSWRIEAAEPEEEQWVRNDQTGTDEVDHDWPLHRPATTLASRDIVPDPGTTANRFNGAEKSRNDGYKITIRDAAILQSFPEDYPFQGTKTKKYEQVGNAVACSMARAVIAQLIR